ncbi:MAG TPA: TolC family protein [Candidatus Deferrimicrobiaceae bacterium]
MRSIPVRAFLSRASFLALAAIAFSHGAGIAAEIPLTMRDIGRIAVMNHPDLRTAAFSPALAVTGVDKSKAIYDPVLNALAEIKGSDNKSSPDSSVTLVSRSWDAGLSLSSLLQTGATASASVSGVWRRDDNGFSTIDSASPEVSVSLSQPLFKGAGKSMTERGITSANYALEIAEADWYSQMLSVAAKACTQFLTLLKTRESNESRKASVEAAKRLHAENDARVKAGVLAPIDLLDSELGVATREVDLLQADKAVRDAEDALRYLLHASDNDAFGPAELLAEPESPYVSDNAIGTALERRPELAKARIAIRNEDFNVSVARNQMLPDLSMKGTAGLTGMGSDTHRGVADVAEARYPFWTLGIELAFPIRNGAARADYRSSRLRTAQAQSALSALEDSIVLEVNNALRTIDTRYRQIGVARKGVQVAESRLASFVKRNALGMATTRNVLDAEADLTAARESLTLAKADYQSALIELWRATGELPEKEGIEVSMNELVRKRLQDIR